VLRLERAVANLSENATIEKIRKVLVKAPDKLAIKDIAKSAKSSPNTVSKYLRIMEERGIVESELKRPFKFYKLKTNKGN